MKENFIRVLGSADWHQTAFNDHSCYTVDDRILIDACPSVVTQLLERGVGEQASQIVARQSVEEDQISLFSLVPEEPSVVQELLDLDINGVTPMEALQILYRLQQKAKKKE